MLRRTSDAACSFSSLLFKIFKPLLYSCPFSSSSNRSLSMPSDIKGRTVRSSTRRPTSLAVVSNATVSDAVRYSDVVHSICSVLCNGAHETSSVGSLLEGYKEKLNSEIVLQVLENYRQMGRIKTLEFFTWAGMVVGFRFDDPVIEYMADFLGRRKLFDDMKCLLVTVSSKSGRVSCRTFSICIRFLGRQGRVREALCLFEEMESRFGCKPDKLVYNNMLYVLCKIESSGELIDFALTIFRRIEWPDKYSYSNMLVGLCKFRRFETALEVFGEMYRAGLVPSRSAVNILIGNLCSLNAKEGAVEKVRVSHSRGPVTILVPIVGAKSGAIEPAIGVFWAVIHLGLFPSAFVINQVVTELCRLGNMQEAIKVLKVLEGRKMSCEQGCYCTVMQALCERGRVEEATDLFGRILSQGMQPKLVVYNTIICMLCKMGNLGDAEEVFKIMNKKRCYPDNNTYSALIRAYGEARNWEAAFDLLMEMLGLGLSPQSHTYGLVEKLLRENGKLDLCLKLEKKLDVQVLQKLCKAGRLEAAYDRLKSMLEKGFCPPIYVRDAFQSAFQKYGRHNMARQLLEKMDEMK